MLNNKSFKSLSSNLCLKTYWVAYVAACFSLSCSESNDGRVANTGGTITAGGGANTGGTGDTGATGGAAVGGNPGGGASATGGTAATGGATGTCPLPTTFKWTFTGPLAQPNSGWVSLKDFSSGHSLT